MRPPRCLLFAALVFCVLPAAARAEEPFFKKGDVIAIVGGEDMVALSEYGYLELLLTRALPDCHLRFRNLAWEGDTVFEQRRDLGFPPWEEQLEKIGATVVVCQFGQMESLAGKEKLPEFIAAYEKLLARFSGGGKRRVGMIESCAPHAVVRDDYVESERRLAQSGGLRQLPLLFASTEGPAFWTYRDGVHLDEAGHQKLAALFGGRFTEAAVRINEFDRQAFSEAKSWIGKRDVTSTVGQLLRPRTDELQESQKVKELRQLIIAKNRLWFDYWRVQNWAFLAGDRTNQPSSRDHLDPAKRWFPEERERFLPLIEAREKEIDALAEKLAKP